MSLLRPLAAVAATLATLSGAPAMAATQQPQNEQLRRGVEVELPKYGFRDVDVSELSNHQLAALHSVMYGGFSQNEKRGHIKSILGGPHSLRGLLFGN